MSYETEELSLTFADIEGPLNQPVLEDRVLDITQEALRFREAFRSYDATSINSNVVEMPVPNDDMGEPKIVEEGAEFPREQENYSKEILDFDKFGFEVPITMEAERDSKIDLTQDQINRQAREMREDMNRKAFEAIDEEVTTVSDSDDGVMNYDDILFAREELQTGSYNPDLLIVDVQGTHDLMGSNNFLNASEMQGNLRRSGQIGQVAGMDVVQDDSGIDIAGDGGPGGLMVDTDFFGYEGEREPITSEEYGENRTQTDVYRIWGEYGWIVTDPDAGRIINA